jgi:GNAT superfamily N-acetyltransferase
MAELVRTTSENKDFIALVSELDSELAIRDGADHAFYSQYNKIDLIRHVIVAYDDGVAVSCGAIKPFDEKSMEVKRMYTKPSHRSKGIAMQILHALELWTAELGYHRCVLETGKKQPEAIALYKKAGYKVIPNYGQYVNVENSVCFEKPTRTAHTSS